MAFGFHLVLESDTDELLARLAGSCDGALSTLNSWSIDDLALDLLPLLVELYAFSVLTAGALFSQG